MSPAQFKIAAIIGARPADIKEISFERLVEELEELKQYVDPDVLEVAGAVQGGKFWRFGTKFFFDDPEEEDPVNLDDLRYDSQFGLHSVDEINEWKTLK